MFFKVDCPAELRPEYERIMKQQQDRIVRNEEAQSGFRQNDRAVERLVQDSAGKTPWRLPGQTTAGNQPSASTGSKPNASATSNPMHCANRFRVVAGRGLMQGNPVSFRHHQNRGTRTGVLNGMLMAIIPFG